MVENHIRPVGQGNRILAAGAANAHPVTHEPRDGAVGVGIRQTVAIDSYTFTGGRLSGDRNILADDNPLADFNHAPDVKYHRSVGLADRIPKRAVARIVKIGHMIHRAAPPAGGPFSKTLGSGKGGQFCLEIPDRAPCNPITANRIHTPVIGGIGLQ